MKHDDTDMFLLKRIRETDGPLLTDLFDFPLSSLQADRMAGILAAADTHMLIMRYGEVQGIIEEHGGWIGYRIRRCCRGRGAASAAVHLLLEERQMEEVRAKSESSNAASRRVLEKNGFRQEGEKDGICFYLRKNS